MMWWWGGEHMGAAGWVGLIFMVVFWIAFIAAIVFLVRYLVTRSSGTDWGSPYDRAGPGRRETGSDALRILEERYARGEIDRDEFLRRRDDLLGRS